MFSPSRCMCIVRVNLLLGIMPDAAIATEDLYFGNDSKSYLSGLVELYMFSRPELL